jgi:hydroxylamine dehydrogenase
MLETCSQCHAGAFTQQQLAQGDAMIKQADRLMAEAVRIVVPCIRMGCWRSPEGPFHASPDYALWYGWSEMQRDLTEIREAADSMRRDHKAPAKAAAFAP